MEDLFVMAIAFAVAPIVVVFAVFISRYRKGRYEQERLFAAFERAKTMKASEHSQI